MHRRSTMIPVLLALVLTVPLAGCGDSDNTVFIGDGTPTPTPTGRTPTPTLTATPLSGATPTATVEPTATVTVAGPTATPTPVAGACQTGDQIVVVASLDTAYGAARIDLAYPDSLNIPGTGTDQSVADRVVFAASGGLPAVNDFDQSGDSVDDTLTASLVSFTDHPAGTFVTVTFDCVAGQAPPSAGDFACTVVSASTGTGAPIPNVQCSLDVTGP